MFVLRSSILQLVSKSQNLNFWDISKFNILEAMNYTKNISIWVSDATTEI